MNKAMLYWMLQIAGWGLYVGMGLVLVWPAARPRFAAFALVYAIGALTAMALSHLWRRHLLAHAWLQLPLRPLAWRVALAVLILGFAQSMLLSVAYWVFLAPQTYRTLRWLPAALFSWSFAFLFWFTIYAAVQMAGRARRAEMSRLQTQLAMREAELRTLQGQVNPHFLFNSFNSLRALIYEEPGRAGAMVDQLALLLRYSLRSGSLRVVTLREEMEAVESYLRIEKIRFEERLEYTLGVSPSALEAKLPPMLLQSLVENAVKHGVEPAYRGELRVAALLSGDLLTLRVENTGSIQNRQGGTRIGLENAQQRLRLLFGERASLTLCESDGRVVAEVQVPQALARTALSAGEIPAPQGGQCARIDRG
jgi:hypothetical protein